MTAEDEALQARQLARVLHVDGWLVTARHLQEQSREVFGSSSATTKALTAAVKGIEKELKSTKQAYRQAYPGDTRV